MFASSATVSIKWCLHNNGSGGCPPLPITLPIYAVTYPVISVFLQVSPSPSIPWSDPHHIVEFLGKVTAQNPLHPFSARSRKIIGCQLSCCKNIWIRQGSPNLWTLVNHDKMCTWPKASEYITTWHLLLLFLTQACVHACVCIHTQSLIISLAIQNERNVELEGTRRSCSIGCYLS